MNISKKRIVSISAAVLTLFGLVGSAQVFAENTKSDADTSNRNYKSYLYDDGTCSISSSDTSSDAADSGSKNGSALSAKIGANSANVKTFIEREKDKGFSGANLAAMIAIGARESGWDPNANNTSGQVKGIFQWGAGSINGNRYGDTKDTLDSQLDLMEKELSTSHAQVLLGGSYNGDTYKGFANALDDKTDSLMSWSIGFEGVSYNGDSQTNVSEIEQFYDDAFSLFPELKSIKGDSAKLKAMVSSASSTATANSSGGQNGLSSDNCSSDSSGTTPDGTGVHTSPTGTPWLPEDLPADVKKYIIDPAKLGMSFGSSKGWTLASTGGQCTDLSRSFMVQYSGKMISGATGNGVEVTSSPILQNLFGTKKTDVPSSVSVFSQDTGTTFGHTGIVEHVYANGDFLIVEQNYVGVSGDDAGKPYTWDYRIVPKDQTSKYSFLKVPAK
ncbi:phage tail tip lysozyme [Lactococcus insecticola]|uniref:Amidase n=1 Tax=Pseudolactococcus insecticola TaxID=2709158 RepID=A0A6A0B958_9LACT|nr:phage tail tip lysozyme [Lactococcus insecticola]GFH41265.1 amidase [Lactococcus insecticola]